jgi:hypothetical protein
MICGDRAVSRGENMQANLGAIIGTPDLSGSNAPGVLLPDESGVPRGHGTWFAGIHGMPASACARPAVG